VSWLVAQADARNLPLADGTADLILTSPPYWGLRSYRDGGEHIEGQVGAEPSPQAYVDELVGMIDSEWRRVLKPAGSLFLVLDDKYSAVRSYQVNQSKYQGGAQATRGEDTRSMARPKSRLGLPWRIALALIDRAWILRAEIIWAKPNGLPESVRDRVRRSHETIFHLTLSPTYYSAVDEIREPYRTATDERGAFLDLYGRTPSQKRPDIANTWQDDAPSRGHSQSGLAQNTDRFASPLGRLPGSVWTITSSPLIVPDQAKQHYRLPDHFAAYPPELCRRIILGWSPRGGRVVDPFCGTGTTVGVAHHLGRQGLGVDLSADYCRLARWRIESGHFARAEDQTWADRQEPLPHTLPNPT
jgi:site-specific DNA-methyltransferase (cytosine-N4-specific)